MKHFGFVTATGIIVALLVSNSMGTDTPAVDEAYQIGMEAYVYFYPLVTMDVTRRQLTNIETGKMVARGPMNTFVHIRAYPTAEFKEVVRPNFDTLYSTAWLDLSKEPIILSVPDTAGRYYLLPVLDMWSDVFAVPGKRTSGTRAADYALVAPGWKGKLPDRIEMIQSPTPYVWIIGRTQTNGPSDYEAVHKVQDGYRVQRIEIWTYHFPKLRRRISPYVGKRVHRTTPDHLACLNIRQLATGHIHRH